MKCAHTRLNSWQETAWQREKENKSNKLQDVLHKEKNATMFWKNKNVQILRDLSILVISFSEKILNRSYKQNEKFLI